MILMGVVSYNSSSCRNLAILGSCLRWLSLSSCLYPLYHFGFFISLHLAPVQALYGELAWFLVGNRWLSCPNATLSQTQKHGLSGQQLSLIFCIGILMVVIQVHYESIPNAYFFYKDLRNFISKFCQLRVNVGSSVMSKAMTTPREKTLISVKYKFIKLKEWCS